MSGLISRLKRMRLGDVLRRNPLFYDEAMRVLRTLKDADLAQRRAWTSERLSKVLWAARRSGYGRKVRGTASLETWPLLAQQQVRADPRAFYSGPRWLAVAAHTGGTSGAPLLLLRSAREIALEQAFIDFVTHEATGLPADARCAVLHTEEIKDPNDFRPPYWIFAAGGRRLVCSAGHLNADTIAAYAQILREFRPQVLFAYPTSLEALCLLLRRAGEQVHIPHVACSSEMLHPHVWALARETLGCTMLDRYGQAERVARACATEPGQYRFVPGYAHVELVQVDAREDRKVYEIVGTSLWNPAMTLVRYRTGDLVHLPALWGKAEMPEKYWREDFIGQPVRVRLSPLLDPFLVARYKDAASEAFSLRLTRSKPEIDSWFDRRFLNAALKELKLEGYWPEYDASGELVGNKVAVR